MSKKPRIKNWPRPILQWGVIVAILVIALMPKFNENFTPDFEAYCPFGGIQALGSYLLNQALSCTMTSAQIVMGIILLVGVFIFSKLFCSYICPIGTISEWLGKLGDKLKVRITIRGIADKALRILKYALLFITLFYTFKSNELFCKKFDPYFGVASGFNTDVVVLYAVLSIVLVILGSVFIRLFWCKYICPLGAISNIFKFTGFFVAIMVIYLGLLALGVDIHYAWPLAIACIGGFVIEIFGLHGKYFPVVRITRNENTCTNCQLCSHKCPQAIDVASLKVVRDADCNLCGECIDVCPVKNTVQVNKKSSLRWLAPIATVVLVVLGLFLGKLWEVPTIDQKWYDDDTMAKAEVFTQSGLKNIKCYGSSMAFASKMKQVEGVLGVATYVKHKRVKIYYDPSILTEEKIQETLFTPSRLILRGLKSSIDNVTEVTLWLENFFDIYDFNYLARLLQGDSKAIALVSEYDCPVMVKLYFPGNIKLDKDSLVDLIESESLNYTVKDKSYSVDLDYKVAKGPEFNTIKAGEYILGMFSPYEAEFNDLSNYSDDVVKTLELPLGDNSKLRKRFTYLVSHLSNDLGIVSFKTFLNDSLNEMVEISYVDTMTTSEDIFESMNADTLQFTYSSGKIGKVANMFSFEK